MKLAIDLDNTLIATHPYKMERWGMKGSTKYLSNIQYYCKAEFHLITARKDRSDVKNIVRVIEDELGVYFSSITVNCSPKVKQAKELGCTHLIDDNASNFSDKVEGVKCIHFGNRKAGYDSWREVYRELGECDY